MSKKSKIKKAIDECEREMRAYERKIERSQNALVRAFLKGVKPSPDDEQYFTVFSNLIDEQREKMRLLCAELNELQNKN